MIEQLEEFNRDSRTVYSDANPHPNALQVVRPRHREIMRRLVCGQTQRQISREMGLNEPRLSIICNSPLFKIELKKLEREIQTKVVDKIGDVSVRIAKLQGPAIDVLEEIVKDEKKAVSYNTKRLAAMDILELSGAKKGKNDDGMSDWATFVSAAYAEAKQRHVEKLNRELIDASEPSADPINITPGEVLSVEDAEDEALIHASVSEDILNEEEASSAVSATSSDALGDKASTSLPCVDVNSPSPCLHVSNADAAAKSESFKVGTGSFKSSIASVVASTINTGVVSGSGHAVEAVRGGKRACASLEDSGDGKKKPYVRFRTADIVDPELEDPEAERIVRAILDQNGLGAGIAAIKELLENNAS